MNILYLCADTGIPIRGHKGSAVHVRSLTDAFAALGHRVTLLTPRAGPANGPTPAARMFEVHSPSFPAGDVHPREKQKRRSGEASAQAVYLAAREILANEPFDFVYERYSLWSDAGARLAHEAGLPLVVEVNAPLRAEAARHRGLAEGDARRAAEIEGRLLSAASTIAVVSAPLRDYVMARGVSGDRVHVLPNAVDERLFHPAVNGDLLRAYLGLADKFVVGFVGTVKPWHDLATLITAVAQLRDGENGPGEPRPCHLLLVGEIPRGVQGMIAQAGLTDATTIAGPIPHADVPSYVAAMDIAVSPHPALKGFYFSPLKLFEYLACGVATVAADVPPIAEVVTDGVTGFLYPPGDASALAERLTCLAADPGLRTRLGWQGASHVLRHHTWQGNALTILNWVHVARNASSETPRVAFQGRAGEAGTAAPLLDDKLRRRLYRATRADVAGPLLAAHLFADGDGKLDHVARLEVLKYKPRRRCVIAYELTHKAEDATRNPQHVIGKVFRDERGAGLFAVHQALWGDGFRPEADDHITVAEPLAYIPEMHMFVQERAPGRTLDKFLGAQGFDERVRRSAAVIAKLHTSHVRSAARPAYRLEAEVENLARWAADLAAWRPDLGPAFARQHDRLRDRAATLDRAPAAAPAHRDFYYGQVLFADPRVTLIDLDMFTLADPAIDVANFAAHLQFLATQLMPDPHGLDPASAGFVDEYARHRAPAPEFFARLAFYQAATFFRLMHVVLQRPQFTHCFDQLFEIVEREVQ